VERKKEADRVTSREHHAHESTTPPIRSGQGDAEKTVSRRGKVTVGTESAQSTDGSRLRSSNTHVVGDGGIATLKLNK